MFDKVETNAQFVLTEINHNDAVTVVTLHHVTSDLLDVSLEKSIKVFEKRRDLEKYIKRQLDRLYSDFEGGQS